MSYTVRLTDTAKQDLREIAFWIAEQSKDKEIAKHSSLRPESSKSMKLLEFSECHPIWWVTLRSRVFLILNSSPWNL